MKAVVLAAGEGTRLRPMTEDKPKALVEVADRPILAHCFDSLIDGGIDDITVITGYKGDMIRETFGSSIDGIPIHYCPQPTQDGTAHALRQADHHSADDLVVMNGDNIVLANIGAIIDDHTESATDITLVTERIADPEQHDGGACVLDEQGSIIGLVEKPETPVSHVIPRGCYVLPPAIFDACHAIDRNATGEYELTDAIDHLIQDGYTVNQYRVLDAIINVNTSQDLAEAERILS